MESLEAQQRDSVVAEAKVWIRTPYHHNARIKGIGVDCANLPLACYHAAGLIPDLRPIYDQQWHKHRDEEKYLDFVRQYACEIDPINVGIGDLLIWKFGRTYSHGGIVVSETDVIHAWVGIGVVRANRKQHSDLNVAPVKAFTLWSHGD